MVPHLVSTLPPWQAFVKGSPFSLPEGHQHSQYGIASVAVAPHLFCNHLCTKAFMSAAADITQKASLLLQQHHYRGHHVVVYLALSGV